MPLKLGKAPARDDDRDLLMARYATAAIKVPATNKRNLSAFKDWGMLANGPDPSVTYPDFVGAGCCVWAGGDHETMLWNKEAGRVVKFTGMNTLADYASTGYNPNDPNSDRGTDVRKSYGYRRKTGLIDAARQRHKLGAYIGLEVGNVQRVKEAIFLFDVVGLGFRFPDYAMDQFNQGKPWKLIPGQPDPTDGHYVTAVAYGPKSIYVVSWGRIVEMYWSFFEELTDECYGLLSLEFLKAGKSPHGFDYAQLSADLNSLR